MMSDLSAMIATSRIRSSGLTFTSLHSWGARNDVKDWVRWVASGELEKLGAQGKRVSGKTEQLLGELFREELPTVDCACLYWYMRNQLYFDLELDKDPRVLIAKYEDAVLSGEQAFRRIFDFLDFPYDPEIIKDVFASSVGKDVWPGIDPRIQQLCDALTTRLDERYEQSGASD